MSTTARTSSAVWATLARAIRLRGRFATPTPPDDAATTLRMSQATQSILVRMTGGRR